MPFCRYLKRYFMNPPGLNNYLNVGGAYNFYWCLREAIIDILCDIVDKVNFHAEE